MDYKTVLAEKEKYNEMYAGNYGNGPTRVLAAYMKHKVKTEGKSILDCGCGHGSLSKLIEYDTYLGVDISDVVIQECFMNTKLKNVKFEPTPLDRLKYLYETDQFDVAVCCDVMEHIPTDCVDQILDSIIDVSPVVVFSISTRNSTIKSDLHLTVRPAGWWIDKIKRYGAVKHIETRPGIVRLILDKYHKLGVTMEKKLEEGNEPLPNSIFGQRIRHLGDGTIMIPRINKEAEAWLDSRYVRCPNQLRWWLARPDEWPSPEPLRKLIEGKTVYLIGKGPSLDKISKADFDDTTSPILCINHSLKTIKGLGLPNPLVGVQYDGALGLSCYQDTPMIVSRRAFGYFRGKKDIYPFREGQYGRISATVALNAARELGAVKFVLLGFDAQTNGNLEYAESVGISSGESGDPKRFKRHKAEILKAAGTVPIEFRDPKNDFSSVPSERPKPEVSRNDDTPSALAESVSKSVSRPNKEVEEDQTVDHPLNESPE